VRNDQIIEGAHKGPTKQIVLPFLSGQESCIVVKIN